MKYILRNFLLNLTALLITTRILPGLSYAGGFRTLILGSIGLMLINLAIIPLLKIMFLPLNLLTLGLFTWVINVIGLYFLTVLIPQFKIMPYSFPGWEMNGFLIPAVYISTLYVAIIASFLIGFISHFLQWLFK